MIVCVYCRAQRPRNAATEREHDEKRESPSDAKAAATIGLGASGHGTETRLAVERVLDAKVLPEQRARRCARSPRTRRSRRTIARWSATRRRSVMESGITGIRTAAVEALGATGPEAVPALTRAMSDYRYEVRVARRHRARAHRPARAPRRSGARRLARPFLGAASESGAALMAIGSEALPIVEARVKASAPTDRARPVLAAVMLTLRLGAITGADAARKEMTHGPNGKGFVSIEPLRTSTSGTADRA